MTDTDFYAPPAKLARLAVNYGPSEEGGLKVIDHPTTSRFALPSKRPGVGGRLVSTMSDYFRFAQMMLNRGELDGVRILGRKTIELMTVHHLPAGVHPWDDPSVGFGLGVSVLLDLGKSKTLGFVGNYGWSGAASTYFWVDPTEDLIGILMVQLMPSGAYPISYDFRNLVYQALVD
jgi:CubicO group peptidase (beta-lactamase class C family)